LVSLHRATVDHVRQRVLAGANIDVVRREIRTRGAEAFALLKEAFGVGLKRETSDPSRPGVPSSG
jgi:hypothetical protein